MKDTKETKKVICSECGLELNESDACSFGDRIFCADCLDVVTVLCDRCGDRIWRNDSSGDENVALCQDCYDDHYTHCSRCGRLIRYDDAYYEDDESDDPYCSNCIESVRSAPIKSYGYRGVLQLQEKVKTIKRRILCFREKD